MKPKFDVLLGKLRVSDEIDDSAIISRISNLENNEYKITYFESVSAATGTVTKPINSTILLDQFAGGVDAYVSTISNGKPTGVFPKTAGGVEVDVSSFDALGNFVLTDIPDSYPVAIIFIVKIKALYLQNISMDNWLDIEELNVENTIFRHLIMRSTGSDGHRWKITIDDTGMISLPAEDLGI